MTSHETRRQTFKWGTFGKNGDEPLKQILLKDIHDDHIVNIIIMMRDYPRVYSHDLLEMMLTEQIYRKVNKIRVPFKFG